MTNKQRRRRWTSTRTLGRKGSLRRRRRFRTHARGMKNWRAKGITASRPHVNLTGDSSTWLVPLNGKLRRCNWLLPRLNYVKNCSLPPELICKRSSRGRRSPRVSPGTGRPLELFGVFDCNAWRDSAITIRDLVHASADTQNCNRLVHRTQKKDNSPTKTKYSARSSVNLNSQREAVSCVKMRFYNYWAPPCTFFTAIKANLWHAPAASAPIPPSRSRLTDNCIVRAEKKGARRWCVRDGTSHFPNEAPFTPGITRRVRRTWETWRRMRKSLPEAEKEHSTGTKLRGTSSQIIDRGRSFGSPGPNSTT